jgi:protein gp37
MGVSVENEKYKDRYIRDQYLRVKVPFFFKQWGGVQKKKAGRILEGRTWDEMPAMARA